jgi:hypothetical protein
MEDTPNYIPPNLRSHVFGYIPEEVSQYGYQTLRLSDEDLVQEMRELGLDPVVIIMKARLKARERKRLQQLPAFALVQLLYRSDGYWWARQLTQPNEIYIEKDNMPTDIEFQKIGYLPTGLGGHFRGAPGENIYDDIVAIDKLFYKDRAITTTDHGSIAA